ncbi:relaxase/mobilization nuclease domain-containing protein [Pedobacter sp. MC2016-24]|uniref:relaxase/mobilization nuclease domain-containing protein n=1 Tax=Pedobacter sp. MC2016-24 TaxID=2780090 RepID=UPI0018809D0F|nr:relaxase/mobilization nuclease domain-containing protein [Pedobacter sp. MC2016-24]MBE9598701.1 relaxase/mobilization nuclease domain-containing protein [Pedobacter sp. MC2016-24]
MVARIKVGNALTRAFYYNENKIKEGVATCIMAGNYPFDVGRSNEVQRLDVLEKTTSLRESLRANTVHISLNFDPSETLSTERMQEIASLYMDKIGFGKQPYLVYQHFDAGHPHLHIVTTKIDLKGKVINTNNIAKNQSELARKDLEIQFGLVKAEGQKAEAYGLKPAYAAKVVYGKSESRKAIAAVLNSVLKQYKYTSLAELNAVLRQYNVVADRGSDSSRTFKNNGLHYRILNDEGEPVGVPIKASLFYQKPTLQYLEDRFSANETARQPYKNRIKNTIDLYFLKAKNATLQGLTDVLKKEGITPVLRQNEAGLLYGITYIDHKSKCVFNGSSLGKTYSAKAISERCKGDAVRLPLQSPNGQIQNINADNRPSIPGANTGSPDGLLDALLRPEYVNENIPFELTGKKKKKRKKKRII